jgi:hypothetical protein
MMNYGVTDIVSGLMSLTAFAFGCFLLGKGDAGGATACLLVAIYTKLPVRPAGK